VLRFSGTGSFDTTAKAALVLAGGSGWVWVQWLVVRVFSYVFHFLLGAVLLALGFVAWTSGRHTLQIGILPWSGQALTMWVFFSGLAGIVFTGMAVRKIFPAVFGVWNLAVVAMLVRGYFFSSYHFDTGNLLPAVGFVAAALVALAGSWMGVRSKRPRQFASA
jgi:hypothetical protein